MRLRLLVLLPVLSLTACLGGGDDDDDAIGDDIPSNAYCDPVRDWAPDAAQFEREVLTLVNEERASGADCGSEGTFPPAPALTMNGALRCAARAHSKDMSDRDFFDHTNPDDELPWDRMELAGYSWRAAGENIAWGSPTPASVMDGWMASDGHCSNIMSAGFQEIGVGYYAGNYWTQVFGAQ